MSEVRPGASCSLPASGGVNVLCCGQADSRSPLRSLNHLMPPMARSGAGALYMLQHTSARQGDACATKSSTPKPPEEVAALVGFPDQTESDVAPAGFFTQVATKVSIAEDHTSSDVQVTAHSEVHNCLLHLKSDGDSRCTDLLDLPPPHCCWTHCCC